MRLVLSKAICKAEFGVDFVPKAQEEPLRRSCVIELAVPIKGEALPQGTRLLKIYATSPEGSRRIVHLLAVSEGTLFLLFYRDKKDSIGANITIKNAVFRKQLNKHLVLLQKDIENGAFEVWEED